MKITSTLHPLDGRRGAVHVEDVYDTDIDDLWQACTDPARLARWIANVTGDLRIGGTVHADFTSSSVSDGRIEVCDAPHHLLLVLLPETDDEQQIEAWLTAEGQKTRLVVEERGLPLDELHFHGAGWQAHLEDLNRSLVGKTSIWKQRWTELKPAYEAMALSSVLRAHPSDAGRPVLRTRIAE